MSMNQPLKGLMGGQCRASPGSQDDSAQHAPTGAPKRPDTLLKPLRLAAATPIHLASKLLLLTHSAGLQQCSCLSCLFILASS